MPNSPDLNDSNLFAPTLLLSGAEFIQEVCDIARTTFGAHLALIGSLRIAEIRRVFVLGSSQQNQDIELEYYDICPAPCRRVLTESEIVVHLEDVHKRFPDDPGIKAFQSLSYIGFPLIDAQGESIGILALEWGSALTEEKSQEVVKAFEALLPRISAEVSTQIVEHAFQALMVPIDDESENDTAIFRTIVLQAAALSQVHAAVIAQCVDREAQEFRILAAAAGNQVLTPAEGTIMQYDGSPCHNLKTEDTYFQERELQQAFPSVSLFGDLNAESYMGFGIRDRNGQPLGHLAVIHDRPMAARALKSPVLRVIAARAGQELRRHVAETERKAFEETIVVRKKLESLGLMAGTIAHDFNNQLTAIIGHTELAMLDIEPTHPAMSSLQVAEENMWRARDVIGDLMDFAGNTHGTPAESLTLTNLVDQTLSSLQSEVPETCHIEVSFEGSLHEIFGHATQVIQILGNLILNALEALEGRKGVVKIRVASMKISAEECDKCLTGYATSLQNSCVMLEVTDTGRGMESSTAERVFDPFFSTKELNRGLGLAGVLGIARRMHAGLTFKSQPERGTVFRIYFPPAPEDTALASTTNQGQQATLSKLCLDKILVIDDKPEVLEKVPPIIPVIVGDTSKP